MAGVLEGLSHRHADLVKTGRTHLQDATPLTLGQEISGWAAQVRHAQDRIARSLDELYALPQGGTAVGTGVNAARGFRETFPRMLSEMTGLPFRACDNTFALMPRDWRY